jgi:hypothetical protein
MFLDGFSSFIPNPDFGGKFGVGSRVGFSGDADALGGY